MTTENTEKTSETEKKEPENSSGNKYIPDKTYKEELIEAVQRAADIHGEPMRRIDYQRVRKESGLDIPNVKTILRRFTDWEDVCQQAGIKADSGRNQMFAEDEILRLIQEAADQQGEPLSLNDYLQWREKVDKQAPHTQTIRYNGVFDGWLDACKSAGVIPKKDPSREYSRKDIIATIQQADRETDGPLSTRKYARWRTSQNQKIPENKTVQRRFGSWTNACEVAGVKSIEVKTYDVETIIEMIQRAAAEMGEPLTIAEYEEWRKSVDKPTPAKSTIYHSEVGPWMRACEAAGVEHGEIN